MKGIEVYDPIPGCNEGWDDIKTNDGYDVDTWDIKW